MSAPSNSGSSSQRSHYYPPQYHPPPAQSYPPPRPAAPVRTSGQNALWQSPPQQHSYQHHQPGFELAVPAHNQWSGSNPRQPQLGANMARAGGTTGAPVQSRGTGLPENWLVLLALADQYFEQAKAGGAKAASATPSAPADAKAYCKLMATGLGCLEAALQTRLQPRVEALVRLRYAGILFEETENRDEAEQALNKGILLATRNNLLDLKYTMQHLLVQIMFKSNTKSALKLLNQMITDAETLGRTLWIYSFRFLRVSLLTDDSPSQDEQAALVTLQKIAAMSEARRDDEVTTVASVMEAMISLLGGTDGVDAAQRALTRINSMQNAGATIIPQMEVLKEMLDVMCSLLFALAHSIEPKMNRMHRMLDQRDRWLGLSVNGDFEVTVGSNRHGKSAEKLRLRWLPKDDIFVLGYFISGLCKFQRNLDEHAKAEKYLSDGLGIVERKLSGAGSTTPTSLEDAREKASWHRSLKCYMLLYRSMAKCARGDWDAALSDFSALETSAAALDLSRSPLQFLIYYLRALIAHGTNDLDSAYSLYNYIYSSLPDASELSITSRLNAILILRAFNPDAAAHLMGTLDRVCGTTRNLLIKTGYATVKATEKGELVKTKNYLSIALQLATQAANHQLTYIVLAFMCERFFKGVVSEQAEKSARAALQNAKRGRDGLWIYVTGEMWADCMQLQGNVLEAEAQRVANTDLRNEVVRNLTRHHSSQQEPPPAG